MNESLDAGDDLAGGRRRGSGLGLLVSSLITCQVRGGGVVGWGGSRARPRFIARDTVQGGRVIKTQKLFLSSSSSLSVECFTSLCFFSYEGRV